MEPDCVVEDEELSSFVPIRDQILRHSIVQIPGWLVGITDYQGKMPTTVTR